MSECGKPVGGTVSYPCEDESGHKGPCWSRDVPATMRARRRWEDEQAEQFSNEPDPEPKEPSKFTVSGEAGEPIQMSDSLAGRQQHPDLLRRQPQQIDVELPEGDELLVEDPLPDPMPMETAGVIEGTLTPTKTRPGDQPLPQINNLPYIQELVIEDIRERIKVGIERYGTPLQPRNGRDVMRDVYEELIDAATYMRQLIWERDNPA